MQVEPMSESGKRVLVELRKNEDESKIALPEALQEKRMRIYVVRTQEGSKFNVGDEVFFGNETVAINISQDEKTVMSVREADIVARVPAVEKVAKKKK